MTDSNNPAIDLLATVIDQLKSGEKLDESIVNEITEALIEGLRIEVGIFNQAGHRGSYDVGVMVKKYVNGIDDQPVFIIDEDRERVACVLNAYPTWAGMSSEEEGIEQVPGIMVSFDDISPLASGAHELILALNGSLAAFLNSILNNMLPGDQAKQMFEIIQAMMENNDRQQIPPAVVSTSNDVFGLDLTEGSKKIEVMRGWGDGEVGDALYPVQSD